MIIHSHLGAEALPLHIGICNGSIEPRGCQLHIPLPIARWYGDNLDHNWQPRGNAETDFLLKQCGLGDSFWQQHTTTHRGFYDELAEAFRQFVDDYVDQHYAKKDGRGATPAHV